MIIKTLPVGPIMANCFIVGCKETLEAAVIDPGDEADKILQSVADLDLNVKTIINTHGHFDHVSANKGIHTATNAPILIHALDAPMLEQISASAANWSLSAEDSPPPDRTINDGDTITIGKITFKVIHTPGHTPGGISLFSNGHVFVGDTLFADSIGRTDMPGGSMAQLIKSIKERLLTLPDDTLIYPGHNYGAAPFSTIAMERAENPFLNGLWNFRLDE